LQLIHGHFPSLSAKGFQRYQVRRRLLQYKQCKLHEINPSHGKNEAMLNDKADVSTIKRSNEGKEKIASFSIT